MNDAKILNISTQELELSSQGSNRQYNLRLEKIISNMNNNDFKIITSSNESDGKIIKEGFKEDFKKSNFWNLLEAKLPGSKIIDVIHKDW